MGLCVQDDGEMVFDIATLIFYDVATIIIMRRREMKATLGTFEPYRSATTLQEQINRLFNDSFGRTAEEGNLTAWAPVDIHERSTLW
jgi:hypothetical protein